MENEYNTYSKHTQKGSKEQCDTYRDIRLTCSIYKLHEDILKK
jgi:hypothetical protein